MSDRPDLPGADRVSRRVYKYPLQFTARAQEVTMPRGAEVVHVQEQNGQPTLWVQVNTYEPPVVRTFCVFATGEEVSAAFTRYVGTVHVTWTVWHVYENPTGSDDREVQR